MAENKNMKVKYLTKQGLQKFTNGRPTQNVVMKCDKMQYVDIRSITDMHVDESEKGKFVLFLDQITDPQNFGSILRSSMFLGVDYVVVNRRNACGLTPTVSKVSSGALEFMPVHSVKFVSKFFLEAQARMGYKIISTNLDDESSDFIDERPQMAANEEDENLDSELIQKSGQKLLPLDELKIDKKENIMLVLGSEGEGVSRTIAKLADYKVVIPPKLEMD